MGEQRISPDAAAICGAVVRLGVELERANALRSQELEGLAHVAERLEVCTERLTARLEVIARCLGALGRE